MPWRRRLRFWATGDATRHARPSSCPSHAGPPSRRPTRAPQTRPERGDGHSLSSTRGHAISASLKASSSMPRVEGEGPHLGQLGRLTKEAVRVMREGTVHWAGRAGSSRRLGCQRPWPEVRSRFVDDPTRTRGSSAGYFYPVISMRARSRTDGGASLHLKSR